MSQHELQDAIERAVDGEHVEHPALHALADRLRRGSADAWDEYAALRYLRCRVVDQTVVAVMCRAVYQTVRAEAAKACQDPEALDWLSRQQGMLTRQAVAASRYAARWTLDRLADDAYDVQAFVAANPNTPPSALARLSRVHGMSVLKGVACNTSTPPEALTALARLGAQPPGGVREAVALSWYAEIRRRVACNDAAPPEALAILARDRDASVVNWAAPYLDLRLGRPWREVDQALCVVGPGFDPWDLADTIGVPEAASSLAAHVQVAQTLNGERAELAETSIYFDESERRVSAITVRHGRISRSLVMLSKQDPTEVEHGDVASQVRRAFGGEQWVIARLFADVVEAHGLRPDQVFELWAVEGSP